MKNICARRLPALLPERTHKRVRQKRGEKCENSCENIYIFKIITKENECCVYICVLSMYCPGRGLQKTMNLVETCRLQCWKTILSTTNCFRQMPPRVDIQTNNFSKMILFLNLHGDFSASRFTKCENQFKINHLCLKIKIKFI